MRADSIAAAYGLFQVVFADMTDTLADAVFQFRRRREPNLTFEEVFNLKFGKMLSQFRDELKHFSADATDASALRLVCDSISRLAPWRNARMHAQVRMTDHGYELYDWKTRERLEMTCEDIEAKTREAFKAKQALIMHMPNLIVGLDMEADIERELSKLPDLN